MDIHYTVEGFLKDAEFTAHLYGFLKEWKDKFPGIDEFTLEVLELNYFQLSDPERRPESFLLSDDRTKLTIVHSYHKYFNQKGKVTHKPSVDNVYFDLRVHLDKASERYHKLINHEEE